MTNSFQAGDSNLISNEVVEDDDQTRRVRGLINNISPTAFNDWYREREFRQNILNGTPYFNRPSPVKPPERHAPSSLLQCHRKMMYKQLNAPEETSDPNGIFWIGTRFEEDLIMEFLQESVVGDGEYVTNSLWIDFTVETDAGELRIKGSTDPVIVTPESEPLLVTEIKTKRSIENTDEPNRHHKAQVHGYMRGLSEKMDRNITEAVILYGSRTTLDIKIFHVEFDPWFWEQTVVEWAATHTTYRLNEELPPASPEYEWECKFCSYKQRCGKGSLPYENTIPTGLLPNYTGYPREKLATYLQAHNAAKLTPTLAQHHPDLADQYGAFEWTCQACGEVTAWDAVDWNGDTTAPPVCQACTNSASMAVLRGPAPAEQLSGEDHANQ